MAKAKEPMMSDVSPSRSRSPHRRARAARDAADAAEQATLGEQQQVQQHVQPSVEEESDETGPDDACEEPVLKYQRMQADVGAMLAAGDRVTRVALHDDYLALGTETGAIYLTDFHGNLSRRLRPHRGAVHDISIDASGEFVASCSQDGTVVVTSLQHDNGGGGSGAGADRASGGGGGDRSEEVYTYGAPVAAVRLDPLYARRRDKVFIAGGTAGKLVLNKRGWFSHKEAVLHEGEGAVSAIAWRGSLVAWANGRGVKIMDVDKEEPVSSVDKPRGAVDHRGHRPRCQLHWESDSCLLMAWGDTFLILQVGIREGTTAAGLLERVRTSSEGTSLAGTLEGGVVAARMAPKRVAEITALWQSDCLICGVSPFDADTLVLLGYPVPQSLAEAREAAAAAGIPPRGGNRRLTPPLAAQPEVQLVRRATGEVLAADTLPLNGWQNNLAGHYCMASTSWSPGAIRWPRGKAAQAAAASAMHINTAAAAAATVATAATTAGLPPALFIAAPQDLVVARVRDVDDSVAWALQRGDAGAAVRVALRNRHSLRTHSYRDLVARRLEELMGEGRYEAAAAETPLLLGADTAAWEQWIYAFARRGRLDAIAPHVPPLPVQEGGGEALPAASLRLAGSVYMLILEHLLTAKPPLFLETVRRWGHPRDAAAAARRAEVSAAETAASAPSRQAQGSIAAKELYSLSLLMAAIESALRARLDAHVLEAQAELLLLDRQFERAVGAYLTMARVRAAAAAAARAEEDDGASTLGDGAAYSGGGGGGGGGSSEVAPRTAAHVFKLIEQHSLFRAIQGRVLELIQLSQADAGALLVRHVDKLPASQVVPQLRGRRDLQHWYLHLLFTQAPELYNTPEHAQFHALQVSLYAQFAPPFQPRRPPPYDSDFLRFLRGSAFAPLEAALTECEKRRPPLWDEMVFVLGRLGRTQRALSVLLEEVDCARRAIEFVGAHDKDLWYRLIDYSLRNERFLGGLLDHAGVYDVDLAGLIRGVPEGMRIQGLREKLGKITSDYRFQVTLHETCLSSLRSDHLAKLRRLNQMRRRALRVGGGGSSSCSARACCVAEPSPPASAHAQCTPGRGIAASGGLRVFACGHSFHEACLKPQAGLRGGPQRGGSCPVCAGSGGALSGALAL